MKDKFEGGTLIAGAAFISIWVALAVNPISARANTYLANYSFADTTVGQIDVVHDSLDDVIHKLGDKACKVSHPNDDDHLFYYYVTPDKIYIEIEFQQLTNFKHPKYRILALRLDDEPMMSDVCYGETSILGHLVTGKGIHLGSTLQEVMALYGDKKREPESFKEGPLTHLRFTTSNEGGREYEWDLVFKYEILIDWSLYDPDVQ